MVFSLKSGFKKIVLTQELILVFSRISQKYCLHKVYLYHLYNIQPEYRAFQIFLINEWTREYWQTWSLAITYQDLNKHTSGQNSALNYWHYFTNKGLRLDQAILYFTLKCINLLYYTLLYFTLNNINLLYFTLNNLNLLYYTLLFFSLPYCTLVNNLQQQQKTFELGETNEQSRKWRKLS